MTHFYLPTTFPSLPLFLRRRRESELYIPQKKILAGAIGRLNWYERRVLCAQ